MMGNTNNKMFYVFIACIVLSIVIVGATLAYFTASASDDTAVHGNSATTSFKLKVEKITDIDNAFGLVPMKNNQAPNAVKQKCDDDFGRAGCQIYKIIVEADSDTVMFLDGYIVTTPSDPKLETRFANVYTDDEEENFNTKFEIEDFLDSNNLKNDYDADLGIKTGVKGIRDENTINNELNRTDDVDCLFVENEKIGGDIGTTRVFYVVMWVYDNGEAQDYLQGMQLAYHGEVTFITAQGNEISASFD